MDGSGDAARRMFGACGGDAFRSKAMINPMMMRFRPIAPKPVVGGSVSPFESKNANALISKGRTKRKYVRVRRYNRKKKAAATDGGDRDGQIAVATAAATTLQLLPEFGFELAGSGSEKKSSSESDVVLAADLGRGGRGAELWVTVECVGDACMGLEEIGSTDEERVRNLEGDTCPAFVSDGRNRVEWLNRAFKRMVRQRERERERRRSAGDQGEGEDSESHAGEIEVLLVAKPKLPWVRRGFTCQIKLQFKWGTETEKDSKVVPCDAWRMDGGGFAWKLDVKAALTLAPLLQED